MKQGKYKRNHMMEALTEIDERAIALAQYMIENKATVRQTASAFGISKSTAHKDLTEKLPYINKTLSDEVRAVLDLNKSQRHIRGGMATKEKYLRRQTSH